MIGLVGLAITLELKVSTLLILVHVVELKLATMIVIIHLNKHITVVIMKIWVLFVVKFL